MEEICKNAIKKIDDEAEAIKNTAAPLFAELQKSVSSVKEILADISKSDEETYKKFSKVIKEFLQSIASEI